MAENWTDEQKKAMELDDSCTDILVSASAGSGKTAVLVERMIRMITDEKDPVDVDRILVVTFTRAAAREMKAKIEAALSEKIGDKNTPEEVKERLRKQEIMVPHAHIMTIDSFCSRLIKENFSALDIDPGFETADENDLRLLRSDIINKMLEDHYGNREDVFSELSSMYRDNRAESNRLEEMILSIYNASCSRPEPVKWMNSLKTGGLGEGESIDDMPAVRYITDEIRDRLGSSIRELESVLAEIGGHPGLEKLYRFTENILSGLKGAYSCSDFSSMCAYTPIDKGDMRSVRKKGVEEKELFDNAKERVSAVRNIINDHINKYFLGKGPEVEKKAVMLFLGAADLFVDLALEFRERFTEAKKDRNMLDFSDIEHLALELLTYNDNGIWRKTAKAEELSLSFREIMIDEYQDTNEVQERILSALKSTGKGHNRMFMVGDVKQSIYSFRSADPHIFLEKYDAFTRNEGPRMKVDLQANFRSTDAVIEPVNAIFESIMTRETGELDYDSFQKLKGSRGAGAGPDQKAYIIRIRPAEDDPLSLVERQALEIGREIKRITDPENGIDIYDKTNKAFRKAGFSDIGILMRSMAGGKGEETANKLAELGITAEVDSTTGFLDSFEVELMLSCLSLMDNMDQDIPLAAVMLSPAGGFTDSELVIIKRTGENGSLYKSCLEAAGKDMETGRKVKGFLETMREMRSLRSVYPLHEYIELFAGRFGIREYVASMPGGGRRLSNIDLLITKAAEYEKGSYRGLFNFLRYVKRLKEDETVELGESITAADSSSVKIMTVHKSKGLEFPVVFVMDMQKGFNTKDTSAGVLIDDELGMGLKTYDTAARTTADSIVRKAIANKLKGKLINEEMRILYVALTRARDRLYMVGTAEDKDKDNSKAGMPRWKPAADSVINTVYLKDHLNYLDWIMPVAVYRGDRLFELRDVDADPDDTGGAKTSDRRITREDLDGISGDDIWDEELLKNMRERSASYRFEADTHLPAKVSVSALKHGLGDEDEEAYTPLPEANAGEGSEEASLLGTAVHKIFEVMDPGRDCSEEEITALVEELCGKGLISKEVKDLIDPGFFMNLSDTEIFRRMKKAAEEGTLKREQQFVISVPASNVYTDIVSDEQVIIQGITDAFFEEDGKIVIVDYKTDRIRPGSEEAVLKDRYSVQMAWYIRALEMTLGLPVKEAVLYSVRNRKEVHILNEHAI
ncbi:MAG: helicase-exonuclease AddAB subunit AddA [Lachnospiraceae bacterium]|nr:helicase-exonuclease AddAB subunit AddA [Lachnospiraceae bacterium]